MVVSAGTPAKRFSDGFNSLLSLCAEVSQLVEGHVANVDVASSSLVFRLFVNIDEFDGVHSVEVRTQLCGSCSSGAVPDGHPF